MRRSADLDNKIEQLRQFYRQRCRMPSYTEIAQLFGWRSKNAVFRLVKKLKGSSLRMKKVGLSLRNCFHP
ncbi:MAG: hypothetical protein ABIK22_02660 [candidate division WOR-3 bacterium]